MENELAMTNEEFNKWISDNSDGTFSDGICDYSVITISNLLFLFEESSEINDETVGAFYNHRYDLSEIMIAIDCEEYFRSMQRISNLARNICLAIELKKKEPFPLLMDDYISYAAREIAITADL